MSGASPGGLRWRSLDALSRDEAADTFTRCYEGYVIPVRTTGAELEARCRAEDVDLSASYVIGDPSGPAGVGLIARRGDRARLAAFAIVPRARGRGVARSMLSRLIAESEERGDASLELEVFEHNLPAVRLYERAGFVQMDRLAGFELNAAAAASRTPALRTFPIAELAAHLEADSRSGLPWQLESATISRMAEPWGWWATAWAPSRLSICRGPTRSRCA